MNFQRYFPNMVLIVMAAGLLSATTELAAGPLKVNSAEPNTGVQGQAPGLVTIKGVGFTEANSVRFLVSSTNETGGVDATLVEVVDDETLVANVVIPDDATVALYDIEVRLAGGRKGKGTTLFQVQSKNGSSGNDDRVGRGMICTLNEAEDPDATLMDDGDPVYEGGVDQVLCLSGDVVGDNFSPIRFSNLPGGNPKQIKFAIRFLDLAFGRCDGPGCESLPPELVGAGTPDTAYVQVTPYAEQDHIHLMTPRKDPYGMALLIDPRDFEQRYSIQMSSRNHGKTNNFLCYANADGYTTTDDINVFVWEDGASSGVVDGLPDGYTVTTGEKVPAEGVYPPVISPGYAEALICSNIGPNGERCEDRKNRDDLCFVLGTVQIQFTLHTEYQ